MLGGDIASHSNVISFQPITRTGANNLGALFLAQHLKPKHVFISDPTSSNITCSGRSQRLVSSERHTFASIHSETKTKHNIRSRCVRSSSCIHTWILTHEPMILSLRTTTTP